MLVDTDKATTIAETLFTAYLDCYSDLNKVARVLAAESESTVRLVEL